ncbi:MAG: RNA polymerase sigma factor [Lachnospiraceae bacterium]|nr:RNA polymerase sigma factor [Lachnospiraceae bacterium]
MKQNLQQIKKAKLGDAAAFAELYRDIYADLYRFALYTLKNPTDAEDAVSETVTDAFTSIRKLRQEESFSSWIFKILSVKCKKRFQEIATLPEELLRDIPDEGSMGNIAVYMDLRRQFFRLSDEERLIISMHIFAGYSSTEIAEILHMNANTVRSKESRALKKLSDQLEAPVRQ